MMEKSKLVGFLSRRWAFVNCYDSHFVDVQIPQGSHFVRIIEYMSWSSGIKTNWVALGSISVRPIHLIAFLWGK